jgi:hypothetical protein
MLCTEIFFLKKRLIASVLHLSWTLSIVVSIIATVYWLASYQLPLNHAYRTLRDLSFMFLSFSLIWCQWNWSPNFWSWGVCILYIIETNFYTLLEHIGAVICALLYNSVHCWSTLLYIGRMLGPSCLDSDGFGGSGHLSWVACGFFFCFSW